MSLLHSFYCWGAMGVILGSTLFFSVVGVEHWKILTFIWALVPLYNTFNFINPWYLSHQGVYSVPQCIYPVESVS